MEFLIVNDNIIHKEDREFREIFLSVLVELFVKK